MDVRAKMHENRLRQAAKRQGVELRKSRRQDPRALDYGAWWVIDPNTNSIVAGDSTYGMTLEDVERWLDEAPRRRAG
jgi:hypothetical protein